MMRHCRLLALSALAFLVAMISTVVVAAPASAGYPTAWNVTTTYLTSAPVSGMVSGWCFSRDIYLAEGQYHWGERRVSSTSLRRKIYLGAANYKWTDCLYPGSGVYRHTSWLDPVHPYWGTIRYDVSDFRILTSGHSQWGSYLDPQF